MLFAFLSSAASVFALFGFVSLFFKEYLGEDVPQNIDAILLQVAAGMLLFGAFWEICLRALRKVRGTTPTSTTRT